MTPLSSRLADLEAKVAALSTVLLETRLTVDAVTMGLAAALGQGRADDFRLAAALIRESSAATPAEEEARAHAADLLDKVADTAALAALKGAMAAAAPTGVQ